MVLQPTAHRAKLRPSLVRRPGIVPASERPSTRHGRGVPSSRKPAAVQPSFRQRSDSDLQLSRRPSAGPGTADRVRSRVRSNPGRIAGKDPCSPRSTRAQWPGARAATARADGPRSMVSPSNNSTSLPPPPPARPAPPHGDVRAGLAHFLARTRHQGKREGGPRLDGASRRQRRHALVRATVTLPSGTTSFSPSGSRGPGILPRGRLCRREHPRTRSPGRPV